MTKRTTSGVDAERNTTLRRPENGGLTFAIRTEVPSFVAIGYFDYTATLQSATLLRQGPEPMGT
jgi:hypothetical protein